MRIAHKIGILIAAIVLMLLALLLPRPVARCHRSASIGIGTSSTTSRCCVPTLPRMQMIQMSERRAPATIARCAPC